MKKYDHKKIESKWQKKWKKDKLYEVIEDQKKEKYYPLVEFPYPSGDGLHVGHVRSYTAMDIIARKKRAEGYNVLYPIGWDAFGLPTENYAVKTGIHPATVTKQNTDNFRKQLQAIGLSFDWSREINTTDPQYYKWTQWIFLQLFKKGLAYKARMPINWCIDCKIGLANEEVVDAVCERCGGGVETREKEQWMLKITEYADRLDKDLDEVDYPEKIKIQQRNWVGRSVGTLLKFKIRNEKGKTTTQNEKLNEIEVFTTRPDTLFGATYVVLAPEHGLVQKLKGNIENWDEVVRYIVQTKKKTDAERTTEGQEKSGVELKGIKAINPANKEEIPIFVADYVLAHYGTGAIMAVPAHDERDFAFAKRYNLPIRQVIAKLNTSVKSFVMGIKDITPLEQIGVEVVEKTKNGNFKVIIPLEKVKEYEAKIISLIEPGFWNEYLVENPVFLFKHKNGEVERHVLTSDTEATIDSLAAQFMEEENWKKTSVWKWLAENDWYTDVIIHTDHGKLINSKKFSGIESAEAGKKITAFVNGKTKTTYKLRDWVFSRQRYWGEPIPIIHCTKCGIVPVPEKELPVELPDVKNYKPTDSGESPLAVVDEWVNVSCPECSGEAKRETDTMPNWAGSSWYYLAYVMRGISPTLNGPISEYKKVFKEWLPVDWYNGGMEHTTLHLLYSRFWHKFLYDIGVVQTKEPYQKRTSHGLILGEGGEKMSKSKGNVVNPDDIIKNVGADTLRVYEMFIGPFDQAIAWNTDNIAGARRFLEKVYRLSLKISEGKNIQVQEKQALEYSLHATIKKVGKDIDAMKFNTAISSLMILTNALDTHETISKKTYNILLRLLAPFAPHSTEELWEKIGNIGSIHQEPWPVFDGKLLVVETHTVAVQVNGKVRATVEVDNEMSEKDVKEKALALPNIQKWLKNKEIKGFFYVENKVINVIFEKE